MSLRKEFSSGDATCAAFGKEVTGFKKVTYTDKQAAVKNRAGNNKLHSYSLGDVEEEATLEVYMSQCREWEKHAEATTGSPLLRNLPPFPYAVTYLNEDLEEVTDVLTIKILGQGRSIDGGPDGLATELPLLCLGIEYGIR